MIFKILCYEIDFIKKEIYQVERYDYTDYDDFNNNFVIEDDYYNKKYNLFSKHILLKIYLIFILI